MTKPKPKPTTIAEDAGIAPAIGVCHDCGKPVTGERKLCGYHAAVRMSRRDKR